MQDDRSGESRVFDIDEFANHLLEQGQSVSPSQIHGCLTGLLSCGTTWEPEAALDALLQSLELDLHGESVDLVFELFEVTRVALEDDGFAFNLLLPEDDVEIAERTASLSGWCRGFLTGFARGGLAGMDILSADSNEILSDIFAIGDAEVGTGDADEEETDDGEGDAEASYFELVEYLRFAVLNVYTDSLAAAGHADDGAPRLH